MDRLPRHPHSTAAPLRGIQARPPHETPVPAAPARGPSKAHVLVPIRLEPSTDELRAALAMAAALRPGARVTLLHVYPPQAFGERSFHWLDAIERLHGALAQQRLLVIAKAREAIAARVESDVPAGLRASLTLQAECRIGDPAAEIGRFAREQAVDLVLLCRERGGWRWPLWPRLSDRVLSLTDRPVIVVHPGAGSPDPLGASVLR